MSVLKKLQGELKKTGILFRTIWINPGHCRWIGKATPPVHYFSGIDVLKAKKNPNVMNPGAGRKIALAKGKLVVVGALTLPIGLPVMLVTLPFVFLFSGLPFLRKKHLDKVEKQLVGGGGQGWFKLCKNKCARNVAKLMTGIGTPKLEEICDKCRAKVEGLAQEAAELIENDEVETDEEAVEELLESKDNIYDEQCDQGD